MRGFLALLTAAVFLSPAAALDPESKVPYQLRIVLRVGDHPDFTEQFRLALKRDLLGSLQAALGNLGSAEIVDLNTLPVEKWEPIWKTVDEKGLAALDAMNELTGTKTHFLRIDFADGRYELQARQYDGTTGFVTPIIRKTETFDRGLVARLAGLMIGQDFGIMGTFDSVTNNKTIMRFQAGDLGPLDKWVKKNDVFAVLQIRNPDGKKTPKATGKDAKPAPRQVGKRLEGVLMQALTDPKEGICQCRMIFRYEDPLRISGAVGFRAVKLGTTEAPLRLQLVDSAGVPHKGTLQVVVRADDFPDNVLGEQTANRDGVYVSKEPFSHVAFVRVMMGNRRIARIPIEILDDRVEVRKVAIEPGAELKDRINLARRDVLSRITDGRLIQIRCFQDIAALEQSGKNQTAFERGQATAKTLEAISGEVQEDVERLQARIGKELPGGGVSVEDCEKQLQILRAKQTELKEHLDLLQTAIKEENDPTVQAKRRKVQDLTRQAVLFAKQADYDKALATYEAAMAEVKDEATAREAIEKPYQALKKEWALREGDAQHAEARKWIYQVWPTLGKFQDLRDLIPAARQAFEKCKSVGDRLTVFKMQLAGQEVLNKFEAEVNLALKSESMEEEDKKGLEAMLKVKNDLEKLLKDVDDYLRAAMPKAKT